MVRSMKIIRYLCRLTYASWLPRLITSGSELGWDLGLELGLPVGMVLVAPVGYLLGSSINLLLGLALENYFGTWELYFHLSHWLD